MEDRYLFRGKRIDNGKWVEGDLVHSVYKINDVCVGKYGNEVGMHEVDPSTICRCTGRNDKNGKLIYENDIMVAYYDEENPEHGTYVMVVWREYGWVTVENNSDDLCPLDDFTIKHFYVVGNIFDNPELLESEE